MNGTLDRILEERICALIITELAAYTNAQVVPDLRGGGEQTATLPRITIKAESQDTPELYQAQVYTVNVEALCLVEGTSPDQRSQLQGMCTAVDLVFNSCSLPAHVSNAVVRVYGAVPGGETQGREENRLMRTRSLVVHAKLR